MFCQVFDEKRTEFIITAGVTTSAKYAPNANSPHGFMYAVDIGGNWQWGNYFYQEASPVNSITGCKLVDSRILTTGLVDAPNLNSNPWADLPKPYIMEVIPSTGQVDRFVYFDLKEDAELNDFGLAAYTTTSAIDLDMRDPYDGKEYYYLSFVINFHIISIIKVVRGTGEIKWNYQYKGNELILRFNPPPSFLHQDRRDETRMFFIGTIEATVNVISFTKSSFNIDWILAFKKEDKPLPETVMSEAHSYV